MQHLITKNKIHKVLSFLLSILILCSAFPFTASAEPKSYAPNVFQSLVYNQDNVNYYENKIDNTVSSTIENIFPNTLSTDYMYNVVRRVNINAVLVSHSYNGKYSYDISNKGVETIRCIVTLANDNFVFPDKISCSAYASVASNTATDSYGEYYSASSDKVSATRKGNIYTIDFDISEWDTNLEYFSYISFSIGGNSEYNSLVINGTPSSKAYLKVDSIKFQFITSDNAYQSGMLDKISNIFDNLKNWFNSIFEWLSNIVENIKNGFSNLTNSISGFFTKLTSDLKGWFKNVGDWFSDLGNNLSSWFTNLTNSIKSFFSDLSNKLTEWFKNVGQWFTEIGDRISGFFSELWNNITIKVEGITNDIKEWWQSVKDFFHSLFVPEDGFFDTYKAEWDVFFKTHFGLLYDISDFITTVFTDITDGLSNPASGVVTVPQLRLPRNFVDKGNTVILESFNFDLQELIDSHNQLLWIHLTFQYFASAIIYLALLMRSKKIFETIIEDNTGG